MSEIGEDFKALREESKERRGVYRKIAKNLLRRKGICFDERNQGAHLIVESPGGKIDFWPGTGKFIVRKSGAVGRGVFNLLRVIEGQE